MTARKMTRWVSAVLLLLALPCTALADGVGGLRTVNGEARIERYGLTVPAENGMDILTRDILITGPDGSLGVTFKDGSRLSLGPNSMLRVSDYVFDPGKDQYSFLTRMMKGTASFLTGQMAKLAPEAMAVETPSVTIGIRGTHFLVQVLEEEK